MENKYKTLLWQIFNWSVVILITYLIEWDYIYATFIVAFLNMLTKELNRFGNPDYKDHD